MAQSDQGYFTRRIDGLFTGIEPALAIIIGSSGANGAEKDASNMEIAFRNLKFAVLKEIDITKDRLLALIRAAASFSYDRIERSCKFEAVVFYFAGHGGSDATNRPFLFCGFGDETVFIEEIVSPFYPDGACKVPKKAKRLFFFDMCLSRDIPDSHPAENQPPIPPQLNVVPPRGNCLIAYATSHEFESGGDRRKGGYWTRYLWENIQKDLDIFIVLAETWEQTVACTSNLEGVHGIPGIIQGPCVIACMGPFNLRKLRRVELDGDEDAPAGHSDLQSTPSQNSSVPVSELGDSDLSAVCNAVGAFPKWQKLGQNLGLQKNTLDVISVNNRDDVGNCTMEMLQAWMRWQDDVRSRGKPSWKRLLDALEPIDPKLAEGIERSKPWKKN